MSPYCKKKCGRKDSNDCELTKAHTYKKCGRKGGNDYTLRKSHMWLNAMARNGQEFKFLRQLYNKCRNIFSSHKYCLLDIDNSNLNTINYEI